MVSIDNHRRLIGNIPDPVCKLLQRKGNGAFDSADFVFVCGSQIKKNEVPVSDKVVGGNRRIFFVNPCLQSALEYVYIAKSDLSGFF